LALIFLEGKNHLRAITQIAKIGEFRELANLLIVHWVEGKAVPLSVHKAFGFGVVGDQAI